MPPFRPPSDAEVASALSDAKLPRAAAAEVAASPLPHYLPWLRGAAAGAAAAEGRPLFRRLERPRPGDWLTEHEERGQSLVSFFRTPMHAAPHGPFDTIVIVPVGGNKQKGDALDDLLPLLSRWVGAFYQLRVAVTERAGWDEVAKAVQWRTHPDFGRQLLARGTFEFAQRKVAESRDLSRRSCCVVALTLEDLYPREGWNFVFGEAMAMDGAAVVSLCRYLDRGGDLCAPASLLRACKVLAHELGHVFGLRHCVHFSCTMNGSNHLEELDRNGLQLCPVCTAKLLPCFRWDLRSRAEGLRRCCAELGVGAEHAANAAALAESLGAFEQQHGPAPGCTDWRAERPAAPKAKPAAREKASAASAAGTERPAAKPPAKVHPAAPSKGEAAPGARSAAAAKADPAAATAPQRGPRPAR
eukprot:TRINITY_DN11351_c0_g1_i2.p1 TRINITY_DN11351_c0_g1~~TRINITY_DN11351_c0_g1_i2.p1  ORF type:complete len:441 (+),score=153.69 TRINITY_DN11351_c0_g1_i2:79-1323(+)